MQGGDRRPKRPRLDHSIAQNDHSEKPLIMQDQEALAKTAEAEKERSEALKIAAALANIASSRGVGMTLILYSSFAGKYIYKQEKSQ